MGMNNAKNVEEYIALLPPKTQKILKKVRAIIQKIIPDAEEVMRYGIPTYRMHTNVVHFAAYKNHIGFYPTPSVIEAFKKSITKYNWSKGAVQFQLSEAIPFQLIEQMTKYRLSEIRLKKKPKVLSSVKVKAKSKSNGKRSFRPK